MSTVVRREALRWTSMCEMAGNGWAVKFSRRVHFAAKPVVIPRLAGSRRAGVVDASSSLQVENPLLVALGLCDSKSKEIAKFFRISLTWLMGRTPGISQFKKNPHGVAWNCARKAFLEGAFRDEEFHDLVVEINGTYVLPVDDTSISGYGRWTVEHLIELGTYFYSDSLSQADEKKAQSSRTGKKEV